MQQRKGFRLKLAFLPPPRGLHWAYFRFWQILLQKSAADDGRSVISLGAAGYDPPALTLFTQLHATRCTEPEWVVVERPAMRAAAGSVQWQPERTHPGRLVDRAVEAGRASGCA